MSAAGHLFDKCAGARRSGLAHDPRARARVLLTSLLDRLPDLRPEVMHVPRDEGEDGLAEGEQQRRRREQRVGPHVHQEVGGGGTACGGGGRRYGSGERAGARSSMLCSGEPEP